MGLTPERYERALRRVPPMLRVGPWIVWTWLVLVASVVAAVVRLLTGRVVLHDLRHGETPPQSFLDANGCEVCLMRIPLNPNQKPRD